MTHPRILIILGLLLVGGVASCTRPAATAETTPSTSMSASDSPSATPSASGSSATPAMSATPTDAPATAAAPVTAAAPPAAGTAKAPTTTKAATRATTTTKATRTTAAPPPPPPPPATTVKPAGPGTVTLKCYPLGDGRTRVSLTWQNTGFGASVTANGKKYSTSDTTVTGYGAGIPETTPGHGSCSGTVGGITKTGSY